VIIVGLCADDWGFWRTVTGNLKLTGSYLDGYPQLTAEDRQVVRQRIAELMALIDAAPKSSKWKLRSKIGERVKWYKDVEELADR